MNGILVINKPKDYTSRDVVNIISKIYKTKKVGHAGTLDPLATGVLVIAVGEATKILELLLTQEKEYVTEVQLGLLTDTLDVTGNALEIKEDIVLDEKKLQEVVLSFQKEYEQEVPKYSAVKVNGKKLYEYARNNQEVVLPKKLVNIKEIEFIGYAKERQSYTFRTIVSKGTYIRSLIRDIGDILQIPSSMKNLIRTKSGNFSIKQALQLEEVTESTKLLPITEVLDLEKIVLTTEEEKLVRNGVFLTKSINDKQVMLLSNKNQLLAIYQKEGEIIRPLKMFNNK